MLYEPSQDLTGTLVIIHPDLTNDPAQRQNTIGIIAVADINADDFYVGFDDNTRSRYAADALLVLKPKDEIYWLLLKRGHRLAYPDLKALAMLNQTIHFGYGDKKYDALKQTINNRKIQALCTDVLKDLINRQQAPSLQR